MTPAEATLLHSWLDTKPQNLWSIWYDVATDGVPGDQPPAVYVPAGTHPDFARMWGRLNSKRIDAIGLFDNGYKVIELRPKAGPQTIGELHQYRYLAAAEWPTLTWTRPLLIYQTADPMIEATLRASDVELVKIDDSVELPRGRGYKSPRFARQMI